MSRGCWTWTRKILSLYRQCLILAFTTVASNVYKSHMPFLVVESCGRSNWLVFQHLSRVSASLVMSELSRPLCHGEQSGQNKQER